MIAPESSSGVTGLATWDAEPRVGGDSGHYGVDPGISEKGRATYRKRSKIMSGRRRNYKRS